MEWLQVLTIAGSTICASWLMHRENAKETKDFHGRICTLEERYLQLMQRYFENRGK